MQWADAFFVYSSLFSGMCNLTDFVDTAQNKEKASETSFFIYQKDI